MARADADVSQYLCQPVMKLYVISTMFPIHNPQAPYPSSTHAPYPDVDTTGGAKFLADGSRLPPCRTTNGPV